MYDIFNFTQNEQNSRMLSSIVFLFIQFLIRRTSVKTLSADSKNKRHGYYPDGFCDSVHSS
jgi:hypothetical protein